jgi:PRTRC genetic system protein C
MALVAITLPRVFSLMENGEEIRLSDPNPTWDPDAVLNYYMPLHPILANAKVQKSFIEDDAEIFKFPSTLGIKG